MKFRPNLRANAGSKNGTSFFNYIYIRMGPYMFDEILNRFGP